MFVGLGEPVYKLLRSLGLESRATISCSVFQAEGAKHTVLRCEIISQRKAIGRGMFVGFAIPVYKLLRSLGLESRATISQRKLLVAACLLDLQYRFTNCFAPSAWKAERLLFLGLESRTTLLLRIGEAA